MNAGGISGLMYPQEGPLVPYMTLAQTLRANGLRHLANAERWHLAGRPEYAAGSYRKGLKNLAHARWLEWPFGLVP